MSLTHRTARFPVTDDVVSGVQAAIDSVVVLLTGYLCYLLVVDHLDPVPGNYVFALTFEWVAIVLLFQFGGLYDFRAIMNPLRAVDRFGVAIATSFLMLLTAAFALKISSSFSRLWMIAFGSSVVCALFLSRVLTSWLIRHQGGGVFVRNVVIVGSGRQSSALLSHFQAMPPKFLSILGIFTEGRKKQMPAADGLPILGTSEDLPSFIRSHDVDDVIVALPWSQEKKISAIAEMLRELPTNVYLCADLIGFRMQLRSPPSHFGDVPVVEMTERPLSGWDRILKQLEDLVVAGVAVVALAPLMAIIAFAIKLDSHGPVIFRQSRLGFNNATFKIYKFRTMHADQQPSSQQATRDDPRVTRLGKFLRRTSLDELPQLFNVLNGTMSLVGPRPHSVDHNEEYARKIRGYFARHRVKPGITGLAQVKGLRGETEIVEKMKSRVDTDIFYTENWSLRLDLRILLQTFLAVARGRNAY
jgi:Undecaprenyl-phosphate glucose phosphotransferase